MEKSEVAKKGATVLAAELIIWPRAFTPPREFRVGAALIIFSCEQPIVQLSERTPTITPNNLPDARNTKTKNAIWKQTVPQTNMFMLPVNLANMLKTGKAAKITRNELKEMIYNFRAPSHRNNLEKKRT